MATSRVVRWSLLLLVVAGGVYGWSRIEWVERTLDVGYGEEARRNDFLAAERFLAARGIESETVSGLALLDALPPTDDLLILSAARESLSARRRRALVDWVEAGGHLLVVAHAPYDVEAQASRDPLLDELGVLLLPVEIGAPEEPEGAPDAEVETTTGEVAGSQPRVATPGEEPRRGDPPEGERDPPRTLAELLERATAPDRCRPLGEGVVTLETTDHGPIRVELAGSHRLAVRREQDAASDTVDAAPRPADRVIAFARGEGRVVAVTSIRPFRNARIHCHDHAFFLATLVPPGAKVWMLHDPDVPSLAGLMLASLPLTTGLGLLLVLLACSAASLRFGVAPPPGDPPRRELREHLEASVAFLVRHHAVAPLFERLRADLARRAPEDPRRWAARAHLSHEDAMRGLAPDPPRSQREILRRARVMLRMRRRTP